MTGIEAVWDGMLLILSIGLMTCGIIWLIDQYLLRTGKYRKNPESLNPKIPQPSRRAA